MTDERLNHCTQWQRMQWKRLLDSELHGTDGALQWNTISGSLPRPRVLVQRRGKSLRRVSVPPLFDPWAEAAAAAQKKRASAALAVLGTTPARLKRRMSSRAAPAPPSCLTQVKRLLANLHKHQRWHHGLHRGSNTGLPHSYSYSSFTSSP
jgi:hypothetical protein